MYVELGGYLILVCKDSALVCVSLSTKWRLVSLIDPTMSVYVFILTWTFYTVFYICLYVYIYNVLYDMRPFIVARDSVVNCSCPNLSCRALATQLELG